MGAFVEFFGCSLITYENNKKVLLRERKRHTDRHATSTRYAAPARGGTPGGAPIISWMGYPPLAGWGTPHYELDGVPPTISWMGYPPTISWMGYPPPWAGWGSSPPWAGWGTPHHQLDGVTPHHELDGVPPPGCGQINKLKILPPLVLRTRSVIMWLQKPDLAGTIISKFNDFISLKNTFLQKQQIKGWRWKKN